MGLTGPMDTAEVMDMTRKKWATTTLLQPGHRRHSSEKATYEWIANRARQLREGLISSHMISLWVDDGDGQGWQLHERINLRDAAYAATDRCPRCDSHSPELHPAVQHGGEVEGCDHEFHGDYRQRPGESLRDMSRRLYGDSRAVQPRGDS